MSLSKEQPSKAPVPEVTPNPSDMAQGKMKDLRQQREEDRVFADITWMPGFDSSAVQRPSRETILTMGKVLLWDAVNRSNSRENAPLGIRRLFLAASTVFSMNYEHHTLNAGEELHNQDWFWVLACDEIHLRNTNGRRDALPIQPVVFREIIKFYSMGFQEELACSSNPGGAVCLRVMMAAVKEWRALSEPESGQMTEGSRKRARAETDRVSCAAPSESSALASLRVPQTSNEEFARMQTTLTDQSAAFSKLRHEHQALAKEHAKLSSKHQLLLQKSNPAPTGAITVEDLAGYAAVQVDEFVNRPYLPPRERGHVEGVMDIYRHIGICGGLGKHESGGPEWLRDKAKRLHGPVPNNDGLRARFLKAAADIQAASTVGEGRSL